MANEALLGLCKNNVIIDPLKLEFSPFYMAIQLPTSFRWTTLEEKINLLKFFQVLREQKVMTKNGSQMVDEETTSLKSS